MESDQSGPERESSISGNDNGSEIFDPTHRLQTLRQKTNLTESESVELQKLTKCLTEEARQKFRSHSKRCKANLELVEIDCSQVIQDQQLFMSKLAVDQFTISFDLEHSYLEYFGSLVQASWNAVWEWLEIGRMLRHEYGNLPKLYFTLQEYDAQSRSLALTANFITEQLTMLLKSGLHVFSRLGPSQFTLRFITEFTEGLSNFNSLLQCCHTLNDFLRVETVTLEVPSQISMKDFFDDLSLSDGKYLAELISLELAACTTGKRRVQSKRLSALRETRDSGRKKSSNKRPETTSDYYSSSASSSKTEDRHNLSRNGEGVPRDTLKIRPQMQQIYTRFLEEKYTVFMTVLDCISQHRNLCNVSFRGKFSKSKSVTFLDDRLKRQRRRFWRQYVLCVWDKFQANLVQNLEFGAFGLPFFAALPRGSREELLGNVYDTLTSVPLPQTLTSPDAAISTVRRKASAIDFDEVVLDLLNVSRTGKCVPVSNSLPTSATGHCLERLHHLIQGDPKNEHEDLAIQMTSWWLGSKTVQLLAGFNVAGLCVLIFMDSETLQDNNIRELLEKRLLIKLRGSTIKSLENITGERLQLKPGDIVNWAEYSISIVLDPVISGVVSVRLDPQDRIALLHDAFLEYFSAWVDHLFKRKFRLSRQAAETLESQIELVRSWVSRNDSLAEAEKERLLNMQIFDYLRYGIRALTDRDSGRPQQVRFYRNTKVSPHVEIEHSVVPPGLPTVDAWRQLRSRKLQGLGKCFSCF